ncbi:MAG: flagellar motor protein MotB [Candidatus Brocadiia bacterium]
MAPGKKKRRSSGKRPVPAYMMSYGDMMTLLLTFFILLVSIAEEQRAGLVAAGTGSFVHAIETLGLPGILPGGRKPMDLGALPPNYTIPERYVEPAPDGHILDRQILEPPSDRLRRTTIEYLRQNQAVALPTAVAFRPGTAQLEARSREALDGIAELAQQTLSYLAVETYAAGPEDGWALSAHRAAAVARYLHAEGGIAYGRITLAGHGRFRPVAARDAGQGEGNDRVTIVLSPKPLE